MWESRDMIMAESLIARIKEFLATHPPPNLAPDAMLTVEEFRSFGFTPQACFPPVSMEAVEKAERELGLPIPSLLKSLYADVSNGIEGLGYEIIGLKGGYKCHCGDLVETYRGFREDKEWKAGLLPFCHWGCNIFSCVDCNSPEHPVFTYEYPHLAPDERTLDDFFEMWLKGKACHSQGFEMEPVEIINPFTRKKATVYSRKPKNRDR
jgi:hypothetical protein